MADNLIYEDPSAGPVAVASDDVGSAHFQRIKLDVGGDGLSVPIVSTVPRMPVHYMRGRVSATPTVSNGSIYAAKDAIGGLLTFANAALISGGKAVIESLTIIDKGQQMSALDLVLFDRTFTNSADNAAFDPTDADLANCVGVIKVLSTDYFDFNDNAVACIRLEHPIVLNGTSLFGQMVSRGTPTYTSTTDLIVVLSLRQD